MELTSNPEWYEYSGVLHIHSRYSDGSGTLKKIIKTAQNVGLDYIIVTDHNILKAMKDGGEGWYGDLLLLVGEEIGTHDGGHYLAFGISETIDPEDCQEDIRRYIKAVKRQDGIGFASHPLGLENSSFSLHLPSWDAWDDPDYTGLEIWSYMCDWSDGVTWFNILRRYLHPERAIHGPSPDLLRRWDQLSQMRRIVGIGGADVHAKRVFPFSFIKVLSYKKTFRGIRTHLLTQFPLPSDLDESRKLVYSALSCGHCFFAHDSLADSTGFTFTALTSEGQRLMIGDEARLRNWAELKVVSPVTASLRLLRDGSSIQEAESRHLICKVEAPGVYRVEAYHKGMPWVFTNSIYLR